MKKWIVAMLAVLVLGVSSCVPTTKDIRTLNNDVDSLMVLIDNVQENITLVNDAVKETDGLVDGLTAGIEASKPFNPYADEMNALLGLLVVAGGLFGKKKLDAAHREFDREAAKRQADKEGREKTLRELASYNNASITAAKVSSMMYTNIGEARKA